MREEFSGNRLGQARMPRPFRRPGARGRIRYAHGGAPRVEPYCTMSDGPAGQHGTRGDQGVHPPVGGRHGDLWVLVCGGIAAATAFAAAFVASGGVASHPAAPGATMPAVVSQACPAPSPTP
jgi:hypothetical protein